MKRLFIGIEIEGEARQATEALLTRLRDEVVHQAVRWVRPEKAHVTVLFLGHVPDERLPAIEAACATASPNAEAFELTLSALGGFPDLRRPRVVWLGLEDSPALDALHAMFRDALADLTPLEDRPFQPHITLARVSPGSPAVGQRVQTISDAVGSLDSRWPVTHAVLFESTPDGRYLALGRYELSAPSGTDNP
jgi:2'-5' RNA ligase